MAKDANNIFSLINIAWNFNKEKNSSNISRTNWAALETIADEEINYSDIPPLTEKSFEKATLRIPATQAHQWVQIDPDVLKWL